MAAIITSTKPDKNYYVNIIELPDHTWSSEQMDLNDTQFVNPGGGSANQKVVIPGLRSIVAGKVTEQAAGMILKYAGPDIQRNALYVLSTTTTGTAHDQAAQTMQWVKDTNAFRDTTIANVRTLNFNQLVAYQMPAGVPPWPAPPAFLVPAP